MDFDEYCKKCPKDVHCCRFKKTGFTFVGLNDAKRINRMTKKGYDEFLDYSKLPKKIIDELKNSDPSLEGALRYSQLDENKILRLLQKKDKRCIFLDDEGKCEIYAIRPNICKIYPYWAMRLTDGKIKVIEHDEEVRCRLIMSKKIKDFPKEEIIKIKKLFKEIEKEDLHYKKNIRKFILHL